MSSLQALRPSIVRATEQARSQCVLCGDRGGAPGYRSVCASCISKVADYNAMAERVDDALVGSERVAVRVPLSPHATFTGISPSFWAQLKEHWSSYPIFKGELRDIDHLSPSTLLPSEPGADEYIATLAERGYEYRLAPRHQARALVLLDFLAVRLRLSLAGALDGNRTHAAEGAR